MVVSFEGFVKRNCRIQKRWTQRARCKSAEGPACGQRNGHACDSDSAGVPTLYVLVPYFCSGFGTWEMGDGTWDADPKSGP